MTSTEIFLDLYKQMESELEKKYKNAKRRFSSVVYEYRKDHESEPIRDQLETCREIRNLLTHTANVGGEPVVQPSEPIISMMREVLCYVEKPPLALSFATKKEQILTANLSQRVMRLMEVMTTNGFSHVPVMENGLFFGVFSAGTIFRYNMHGEKRIDRETKLSELKEYLPIRTHFEEYAFLPETATYMEVKKTFDNIKARNRRVHVVFITKGGEESEPLLGMVTPWDVIKNG